MYFFCLSTNIHSPKICNDFHNIVYVPPLDSSIGGMYAGMPIAPVGLLCEVGGILQRAHESLLCKRVRIS